MIRSIKTKEIILIILLCITVIIVVPTIMIRARLSKKSLNDIVYDKFEKENREKKVYTLIDAIYLTNEISESDKYKVEIGDDITYNENLEIKITIDKTIQLNEARLVVNKKEYEVNNNTMTIKIKLIEGSNNFDIVLNDNGEKIKELNKTVYYIKPYVKQFADKMSFNGICTHYRNGTWEKYEWTNNQLKALGVNYIRVDFSQSTIQKNGKYDYSDYDKWIRKLKECSDIDIIYLLEGTDAGKDNTINNDKELKKFVAFTKNLSEYYKPRFIEVFNESNYLTDTKGAYLTEKDTKWYSKLLNEIGNTNEYTALTSGTASTPVNQKNIMKSTDFIMNIYKTGGLDKVNSVAFHPYSVKEDWFDQQVQEHKDTLNKIGGFMYLDATEFGYSNNTPLGKVSEEEQANKILKRIVKLNRDCRFKVIYNLWTISSDENSMNQYGLLNSSNYTPKKSYYSMKKYYENTNGSEYIGQINLADGLEAYVYDKDGKNKIIVWATDSSKPVSINYNGFTASDLYGNAIENSDGKLEITDSPVYLDNVSTNYFYQAISNSITVGYADFNTKFKDEISKVNGLNEKIDNLSTEAKNIFSLSEVDENTANNLMKQHFELGNELLTAYKNGQLKIEYVKLSSMLDSLNTIGNSYEDLVTVSAKTRMTDLTEITNEVNKAKSLAEDNEQFDIVYPNKIYKFAQDLLDTSRYVLGLDEENDIKTGLINSKALHAKYLANWSQEFSKIYIKDALKTSTNSIIKKNEIIKNNNKAVYENPNVKNSYDKLQNSIKTLIENPQINNVDEIYLNQMNIAKTIIAESKVKTINMQRNDYKQIISNILSISDDYKPLYNYYIKSDKTDRKQIENNLNNVINRYNENLDIEILSSEAEIINQAKDLYDDSIETDKISDNYLNKQRILQTCDIISQMLENDIKQQADIEFTQITKSSNQDLNKYTNQDEIITINLPNDKAKVTDNNGENSIKFSKNDSKTIKINIRGYEYDYKVEVSNIDKSYPTLNVQKEGTAITPNATDNNLDKITIMKDGKEIKYNIGSQITEPGIYEIIATDKAGNKVNTKSIVYGTFTNEQNEKEKYVPLFPGQKTQSIIENSEYSIANDKQQKLGDDLVATGDKLKTQNDTYIVIVKGDVTGAGKADIMSLIQLRKNIVGLKDFTKIQQLASDINSDGRINNIDLVSERKLIVGGE